MDFFDRSSIYIAAQRGVGAQKINRLFYDGVESDIFSSPFFFFFYSFSVYGHTESKHKRCTVSW